MFCERDRERRLRIQATVAVSYLFDGERYNRVLCDECADDTWREDDPDMDVRLLEPGEKRADVFP